jgi:hypothetical protein
LKVSFDGKTIEVSAGSVTWLYKAWCMDGVGESFEVRDGAGRLVASASRTQTVRRALASGFDFSDDET